MCRTEQRRTPDILSATAFLQMEEKMVRALILWLMGVPLFVVLLLWYFFF
jgi:hypothetical protein